MNDSDKSTEKQSDHPRHRKHREGIFIFPFICFQPNDTHFCQVVRVKHANMLSALSESLL